MIWFLFIMNFLSFLLLYFFFYFLVEIIKPKPLPRNVINGNFIQANSSNNSTTNNSTETINTTTNSSAAIMASETITTNTPAKSVISQTATTSSANSTTISKTESLIQRFSFNSSSNNGKSPPEVMKRMNSKQIATIFEVR